MNPADLAVGAVVAVGLILFGLMLALGSSDTARALETTPSVPCDEANEREGRVRVGGRARCAKPLIAPLSQKSCVYYALTVSEVHYQYERQRTEQKLFTETEWAPGWRIEDDTGALELQAEGADVQPQQQAGVMVNGDDEQHAALLERYRLTMEKRTLHVHEDVITEGARVFAVGELRGGESPVLDCTRGEVQAGTADGAIADSKSSGMLGWVLVFAGVVGGCVLAYSAVDAQRDADVTIHGTKPAHR